MDVVRNHYVAKLNWFSFAWPPNSPGDTHHEEIVRLWRFAEETRIALPIAAHIGRRQRAVDLASVPITRSNGF